MVKQKDALIVFSPSGKRGRFPLGTPILQAARELGVDIDSICGGRALCGRCLVEPVEGSFARENIVSHPDNLACIGETEKQKLLKIGAGDHHRLACMATLEGDIRIDVPAASQVHRQVVRKDCELHDIAIDPIIKLFYLEVEPPDIDAPEGDLQRLERALEEQWQITVLPSGPVLARTAQQALREGKWNVTVALRDGRDLVAIWPGFREQVYGAAIDVGSTTIAAHLCELSSGEVLASSGVMNPQIRFGEDLMSRVSYSMLNEGGGEELTDAVRGAINELLRDVSHQAGIEMDKILELVMVGNPVMHHLLLGLDVAPIGVAPFTLATDHSVEIAAAELDLDLLPGARAYLPPCIAGYVGADATAMLLAETPWDSDEVSLLIDVGTNAELILGNRQRLLAASSPTGPAFEGAQISNGQRAAAGAIERVRIDAETLDARFRVIGCDLWSDEPGFEEATVKTGVTGICGSGIIEAIAGMFLAGIVLPDGSVDGTQAKRNSRIRADDRTFSYILHAGTPEIIISQNDIRAVQLAKAALHAGARLLMDKFGVEKVDRIRLAGAFGSHIDVKYAMVLGMIPDCDLDQVSSAANAAGTGARICLLNGNSRAEIGRRARRIEKIETAVDPNFQQHFVEAMAIPHASDEFSNLTRIISLPKPKLAGSARVRRGRRKKNSN